MEGREGSYSLHARRMSSCHTYLLIHVPMRLHSQSVAERGHKTRRDIVLGSRAVVEPGKLSSHIASLSDSYCSMFLILQVEKPWVTRALV